MVDQQRPNVTAVRPNAKARLSSQQYFLRSTRATKLFALTLGWVALAVIGFSVAAALISAAFTDPSFRSVTIAVGGTAMTGYGIVIAWRLLRDQFLPKASLPEGTQGAMQNMQADAHTAAIPSATSAHWWTDTTSREQIQQRIGR